MSDADGDEPVHDDVDNGEPSTLQPGKRVALHHMIVAGDRGYGAWRDGGFTIHDLSDKSKPKLLSHINWSPPYPGGTHTPLLLPNRQLAIVADEANAEKCAKGLFHTFVVDVRAPENPVPISTLPTEGQQWWRQHDAGDPIAAQRNAAASRSAAAAWTGS